MNKNLFLIDDDEFIELVFENIMTRRSLDYNFYSFSSFESSTKKMAQIQPEIVLLDFKLPGLNGLSALTLIKEMSPNSKVVLISDSDDPDLEAKALERGAVKFVSKVFHSVDECIALLSELENAPTA